MVSGSDPQVSGAPFGTSVPPSSHLIFTFGGGSLPAELIPAGRLGRRNQPRGRLQLELAPRTSPLRGSVKPAALELEGGHVDLAADAAPPVAVGLLHAGHRAFGSLVERHDGSAAGIQTAPAPRFGFLSVVRREGVASLSNALRLPFLVMSEQPATVRFKLEVFDPIRRAPGTFVLGFVAMCLVVWLLFVLLNENHMNLFVGLQIGFQAFALTAIWRLCERRAARQDARARRKAGPPTSPLRHSLTRNDER